MIPLWLFFLLVFLYEWTPYVVYILVTICTSLTFHVFLCTDTVCFSLSLSLRLTKPLSFADCVGDELPWGWEASYDPQIGIYYIDHINSKLTGLPQCYPSNIMSMPKPSGPSTRAITDLSILNKGPQAVSSKIPSQMFWQGYFPTLDLNFSNTTRQTCRFFGGFLSLNYLLVFRNWKPLELILLFIVRAPCCLILMRYWWVVWSFAKCLHQMMNVLFVLTELWEMIELKSSQNPYCGQNLYSALSLLASL